MIYEYIGHLGTILSAPDEAIRDTLAHVLFSGDDMAEWRPKDLKSEREWKGIPVTTQRTEEGVEVSGNFEDMRRMDVLGVDDVRLWAPFGSLGWKDGRLPLDVSTYSIVEVTYRCTSDNARPALTWLYPGGHTVAMLPPTRRWRTVARQVPHFGCPEQIDELIIRLFSTTRTIESVEIQEIRFRERSPAECEAIEQKEAHLTEEAKPESYPALDDFLPVGVVMDAQAVRRLAELLGVSLAEYWELAFQDIVVHHHNTVLLEHVDQLTEPEWARLLAFADSFGLKIVAHHDFPIEDDEEALRETFEARLGPYADSKAILAWNLRGNPRETDVDDLVRAKALAHDVDPNHPTVALTQDLSAFSLLAPLFPAVSLNYFPSHSPWEMSALLRTHLPLAAGQQLWVTAPAFTYSTGAPEWSSCPEMRLMANLAFACGARGWFSYAYHNAPIWVSGTCQRTLTGPFLNFSDLWLELGRRMERVHALAPLLLQASPARIPSRWYVTSQVSADFSQIPEGLMPTSSFRLRGPDYNLFFVVSNDVRGMSELNIDIPKSVMGGQEIYVLSDFVQERKWRPMDLERHVEMFPGQSQVVLLAAPDVCARTRDVIAQRLMEDDRRQIRFNMDLARAYDLDIGAIEKAVARVGSGHSLKDLGVIDRARDRLVDVIYASPAVCQSRSELIKAAAAICACDGALCRLVNRGKSDLAKELGLNVVPLAREATHLRLELRQGKGLAILSLCENLVERAVRLLAEIRAEA